jgi:serine/threonine protein kinase
MDIKPANVLVKHYSTLGTPYGQWKVYLADFGLSRNFVSDDSQTEGPTARTARYCAPEVYLYESRGRAADIFSMGCVFAEILTVYFGGDPEDLKESLCQQCETDHYHSNIERVQLWVHDCALSSSQPDLAKGQDGCKENGLIAHHVNRMIDESPDKRPTATFLRDYFRLTDGTSGLPFAFRSLGTECCDASPERYVAEGQLSTVRSPILVTPDRHEPTLPQLPRPRLEPVETLKSTHMTIEPVKLRNPRIQSCIESDRLSALDVAGLDFETEAEEFGTSEPDRCI